MYDINPDMLNGEPVCSSNCPGTFTIALRYLTVSPAQNCPYQKPGAPCIPALRQQRDEARAEVERLTRERDYAITQWVRKENQTDARAKNGHCAPWTAEEMRMEAAEAARK